MIPGTKIVMLAGKGDSTNIVYNALQKEFAIAAVILEEPVPRKQFLKKRIKKLGLPKVAAQILFQALVAPILNKTSAARRKEIFTAYQLDDQPIAAEKIIAVPSVNDPACLQHLLELQPSIVVVNGTRIIAKNILQQVPATFINIHAGITPKYRGVHGAYWANVNNDVENCGVTVHLVDAGIDTGAVIAQQKIDIKSNDNFSSLPLLQLAAGIPLMIQAINDSIANKLVLKKGTAESRLWSHPGIFQYFYYRVFKGKK